MSSHSLDFGGTSGVLLDSGGEEGSKMDSPADGVLRFTVSAHGFHQLDIVVSSSDVYANGADEEMVFEVSSSGKSSGKGKFS